MRKGLHQVMSGEGRGCGRKKNQEKKETGSKIVSDNRSILLHSSILYGKRAAEFDRAQVRRVCGAVPPEEKLRALLPHPDSRKPSLEVQARYGEKAEAEAPLPAGQIR